MNMHSPQLRNKELRLMRSQGTLLSRVPVSDGETNASMPADIISAPSPLPLAPLNNSFGVTVMIYKHHMEYHIGDFLGG